MIFKRFYEWPIRPIGGLVATFVLSLGSVACSGADRYVEKHELDHLNVVFLDQHSLHEKFANRSGRSGIGFLPMTNAGMPPMQTVNGFFDFNSNTLYCSKWDFKVCGHELHHAVLGYFHDQE